MTSIIVVTWNNLNLTKQCVEAIFTHTRNFELIIIDNASTDGTQEYLKTIEGAKALPGGEIVTVKIIYNKENIGFVKANNQGILMSTGKYVCLMNNDIVVSDRWLVKLTRAIEQPG